MKNSTEIKKKIASEWFKSLQTKIINQFQLLENENSKKNKKKIKLFVKRKWRKNNKKGDERFCLLFVIAIIQIEI